MKASAAFTAATSIDTPYTPTMLAICAMGRTVTWLYPSRTHGKPMSGMYVRPSSVATHATGTANRPDGPWARTNAYTSAAQIAGNNASVAIINAFTSMATHV